MAVKKCVVKMVPVTVKTVTKSVSFLITKDYHDGHLSIIITGELTLCFS